MIAESEGCEISKGYNPVRGAKVIAFAKDFLDQTFPLQHGSYQHASVWAIGPWL